MTTELEQALDDLLVKHPEQFNSTNRVTNDLLRIWKLASEQSAELAAPVEALLTALRGRKLVTEAELSDCVAALRVQLQGENLHERELDASTAS